MEIIEGNKMIAEFMGLNEVTEMDGVVYHLPEAKSMVYERVKYTYSWDWLMPVVGRIKGMQRPLGGLNLHDIKISSINGALTDKNLEMKDVWLAVVEFIKWKTYKK